MVKIGYLNNSYVTASKFDFSNFGCGINSMITGISIDLVRNVNIFRLKVFILGKMDTGEYLIGDCLLDMFVNNVSPIVVDSNLLLEQYQYWMDYMINMKKMILVIQGISNNYNIDFFLTDGHILNINYTN
jgi:hypothetical protein